MLYDKLYDSLFDFSILLAFLDSPIQFLCCLRFKISLYDHFTIISLVFLLVLEEFFEDIPRFLHFLIPLLLLLLYLLLGLLFCFLYSKLELDPLPIGDISNISCFLPNLKYRGSKELNINLITLASMD